MAEQPTQKVENQQNVHDKLMESLKNETQGQLKDLKNKVEEDKKGIDKKNEIKEKAKECASKLKTSQLLMLEQIVPGTLFEICTLETNDGIKEIKFPTPEQQRNIGFGDIYNAEFRKIENAQFIIIWDERGIPRIGQIGIYKFRGQKRVGFGNVSSNNPDEKYLKALDGTRFKTFENYENAKGYLHEKEIKFEESSFLEIKDESTLQSELSNEEDKTKNDYLDSVIKWEQEVRLGQLLYIKTKEVVNGTYTINQQIDDVKKLLDNDKLPTEQQELIQKWLEGAEKYEENVPEIFKDIDLNQPIKDLVYQAARKYEFSKDESEAIVKQMSHESGFNIFAYSSAGAFGIGQLMPKTAEGLNVDRYNPLQNIDGGLRLMKEEQEYYKGSLYLAMLAYNTGRTNVNRAIDSHGPPNNPKSLGSVYNWAKKTGLASETKNYLAKIFGSDIILPNLT